MSKLNKLLNKNGNIDAQPYYIDLDRANLPPLHVACSLSNFEVVMLLVEKEADINNINATNNYSPLLISLKAYNSNKLEIAKYLVENGADVNYKNIHSETALSLTFSHTNPYNLYEDQEQYVFFVLLIKNGAIVENASPRGNLILVAAEYNSVLVVDYLLENNMAEINVQNERGDTALMYASRGDAKEVVEYLLSKGANKDIKNEDGKTALDIAIQYNKLEIISILNN